MDRKKILVVEDERIVAQDIKNCLEDLGYSVTSIARSGDEAVAKLESGRPDLVLMDIVIEGKMDGVETAGKIHQNYDVPVIYLTAYSDKDTLERAKSTSPFGYILKPFSEKEIYAAIEIALYKHKIEKALREAKLRAEEERAKTEAVIASMGDALCILDNNFTIIYENQVHKDMFGEIGGAFCYKAIGNRESVCNDCPVLPSFSKGRINIAEKVQHTKKGVKHIEITASPFKDSTGEVVAVIKVVRDVTERKLVEQELLKARKLESMEIFAGGIAHDFNNLLTAILGNISFSKMLIDPKSKAHKRLEEAENASLKAKDLANKFVAFSRSEMPEKQIGSISHELINKAVASISSPAVEINISIPEGLWQIAFDTGQIMYAVENLVRNAIEAMPDGGRVTVSGENIAVDEKIGHSILKKGQYVKIFVKDDGAGISEDIFPKIFDPYFSTKERSSDKGIGLGLTISYYIIKNHGGVLDIISDEKKGTTANIYLPAIRS